MPLHQRFSLAGALVASVALAACATLGPRTNLPPHPITVTINNNLPVPTDLTIYQVSTGGGAQILGTAIPANTTTFQMTPRSFSDPYRFLARTPSGRRIWSEEFTVRDADTGEVRWQLYPNILQFYDMPGDSTATPAKP